MTITASLKKKFTAVAVLPFAAALTLSACGDSTNDASNVNIEPVESQAAPSETNIEPVETTPESPAADGETTETAFTQNQNGVEMTLTYTAVGDRVVKQTTRNVIDYQAAGFGSKEQAQEVFDPLMEQSAGVEGYDQSMEYGETSAVEEVSIDYRVVDMSALSDIPGFEGSENMGAADFVSLSESRKLLEQQGFTEVE
ncbi:YehR family lipoprotein [Enteractinococcus helveticum]|uniref:DUF1307 domain-containing protein n=1 Tax=Enteractinococcus helveticum TaxID=1837282 RepID=A0A1B7M1I2_9MICC|nr:YehR family protein [Enteractinococcus helveticum]OAV62399.1 hypothetical protein A6F49_06735 [Enteractinococcus helveticum]